MKYTACSNHLLAVQLFHILVHVSIIEAVNLLFGYMTDTIIPFFLSKVFGVVFFVKIRIDRKRCNHNNYDSNNKKYLHDNLCYMLSL